MGASDLARLVNKSLGSLLAHVFRHQLDPPMYHIDRMHGIGNYLPA